MSGFKDQMYWLLYRNVKLKLRYKQLTFQEVFIPLIFVANLATVRYTTQTDPLPPITSSQLQTYDLFGEFPVSAQDAIAFTPNTAEIGKIVSELASALNMTASPVSYPSEEVLVESVMNGTENISFALVFDEAFPSNLSYKIRLHYGAVTLDYGSFVGKQASCYDSTPSYGRAYPERCPANSYLYSGFSAIQALVEHFIIKTVTGNDSIPTPDVSVRMFPKGQYDYSVDSLRITVSIYIILAYMPFVGVLMTVLVYEKEKKIKECMKIMGLNNTAFWLSWTVIYSVIVLIVALLIAGYSKAITLFPGGNFFLIFLCLFLFGLSVVTMAFMLSPLCQKATSAAGLGFLAVMVSITPYIPIGILGVEQVGTAGAWCLCIFSPVACALFFDRAVTLEQTSNGLNFQTLGATEFPPYACLVMLLVDIILYLLLAIYLENVIPGEYGTNKSPFFCFNPSYWMCGKSKEPSDKTRLLQGLGPQGSGPAGINEDVEPVPAALRDRIGISINSLKKVFPAKKKGEPDVMAVNGITLDIYEGQITCLLGHNGAGKSTLINCLTGLTPATEGDAFIYNRSIGDDNELSQIRSMTGVCLQENTIFDVLSPEEHLMIYAGLKGVRREGIPAAVDDMIKLIDLDNQRATLAKDLSGGQKRKLCVGMAIIGDPKILILDEPSSGMDPYSRRKMWSLLKKQREGRVTLLTTHFMDEADILADRKAIVSKGKLRCYGSSLFLKNKFGLGYHLGMVVETDCDRGKITALIQTHVPEATVSRSHGMELSYRLPLKDVSAFAGMFKSLEESNAEETVAQALGIQSYGVSMTTLEEVFLKIGEEAEMDEADAAVEATQLVRPPSAGGIQSTNKHAVPESSTGMSMEQSGSEEGHSVTVNFDQSPLDSTMLATKPIQATYREQIRKLTYVEILLAIRNPVTYIFRLLLPLIYMIGGGLMAIFIDFGGDSPSETPPPLWFHPSMYVSSSQMDASATTYDLIYANNLPQDQDIADIVSEWGRLDFGINATTNLSALYELRPHNVAVDLMDLGTSGTASSFTAYYNDTAQHSLPVLFSLMSSTLLGLYSDGSHPPVITAASHPFPKPPEAPSYTFNSGILFTFMFCLGLSQSLIGFPVDRVKERETKLKAQLRISGVDTLTYWASVFLIDLAQLLLVTIVGVVIILAIQVPSLIVGGAIFCLLLSLLFYLPAAILNAYCVGFLFDKFETAQGYLFFFFFHIPLLLFLPTIFLDIFVSSTIAGIVNLVTCLLYPISSIFGAVYFITKVHQVVAFDPTVMGLPSFEDYFKPEAFVWPTILVIILDVIWLCFCVRFLEIVKSGGNAKDTCPCLVDKRVGIVNRNEDAIPDEDSDVKAERMRVEEIFNQDKTSAVAILGLRREFVKRTKENSCSNVVKEIKKVAVRNLSLTVQTGEVLGLLGPNGAGKTTTMNVVTADFEPTKGQVRVGGHDVSSALSAAYQSLGYCPQIDPLWDTITLREHLEAFAAFKGIHRDDRKQIAEHYMSALNISEHADKRAKALSGGTKRKLCFALSMLGNPQIVLLDEPSTGMDPGSKRFLWNTITSSFVNKKGAILTTHSMEEADAVCSRVGIMTSGQLRCIGTTQHLKDKYGGGYTLEIKLNPGDYYYLADQTNASITDILDQKMQVLHEHVMTFLLKAEVTESFAERITYKIPRDEVASLSTVFSFLEQGKQEYGIEEYSFSQTTLEQVFIEFAKAQVDNADDEGGAEAVQVTDPHTSSSRRSVRSGPRPQLSVDA